MLQPRPEVNRLDEDQRSLSKYILENAFGNPINFSSAPSLSDMKANTWGFNSTDIYIKLSDDTGIKLSGTAMT